MLRFTIRDLLWLTVVVACLLGWLIDHRTSAAWRARVIGGIRKAQRDFENEYRMFLDWDEATGSMSISRK